MKRGRSRGKRARTGAFAFGLVGIGLGAMAAYLWPKVRRRQVTGQITIQQPTIRSNSLR